MKLKLCNVHKLTLANEGEERKPIHIPFGTWDYDDRITQTLDREHAEGIANELEKSIAAGEPGIPVYQGHPDVPEYAGKYPDKGALGWVKKIMVNEDGMDLVVEWDRDPGKGFGWFSPYWVGDNPTVGADGKKNVVVDGLTSVGLVNNPNIREFRLANEAGGDLTRSRGVAENAEFLMPAHLVALAKRFDERRALHNEANFDESKHPRANDGKFSSTGGGGATPKGDDGKGGGSGAMPKNVNVHHAQIMSRMIRNAPTRLDQVNYINGVLRNERKNMKEVGRGLKTGEFSRGDHKDQRKDLRAVHVAALMSGLKYNRALRRYE